MSNTANDALPCPRDHLREAVLSIESESRSTFLERVFLRAFRGLVYTQTWEDPLVDIEALDLRPGCRAVSIGSAGCNILSYLIADPERIVAVDINPAQVALVRLKLMAAAQFPSFETFFMFFGQGDAPGNIENYRTYLRSALDAETRAFWDQRSLFGIGPPRVAMFAKNYFRFGLAGRFLRAIRLAARLYGVRFDEYLGCRSLQEQRAFYNQSIVPIFARPIVRWAATRKLALMPLGNPPRQHDLLAQDGDLVATILQRLEKLMCRFPLSSNYFAAQALGQRYLPGDNSALPPYLQEANFATIRRNLGRVEVLNTSITAYLADQPDGSLDRFNLLDAQDWMTGSQLNALWKEMTRTARPGARAIFRTAARADVAAGRVDPAILRAWQYEERKSRMLLERDRTPVNGGLHLYVLTG